MTLRAWENVGVQQVCGDLAYTGQPVTALIVLGAACLCVGVLFVALSSGRRSAMRSGAVVVLLAFGIAVGPGDPPAAWAGGDEQACVDQQPAPEPQSDGTLRIVQTSVNTGLGPNIPPSRITGLIHNLGTEDVEVQAVTVSIMAVTKAPGAAAGSCDEGDYLLFNPRMPVGQMLSPGESAPFEGAVIGFRNRSVNQDACKGAVVGLSYRSS